MTTLRTVADMRAAREAWAGASVALVPTMGAFHDGHVALMRDARQVCDRVVVSLFVNPTQFGDPQDLVAYPRDEARDADIAMAAGVDVLFAPQVSDIYPPGHATRVEPAGAALGLEGAARPGHFSGVATVCLQLFHIVRPDVAVFGQKDAQQVAVIEQLVRDLHMALAIRIVPTVRAADGLALSSRNSRLSADERRRALAIPRALDAGLAAARAGADPVAAARAALADLEPEYVAVAVLSGHPTLTVAARVGTTRLIDNVRLDIP